MVESKDKAQFDRIDGKNLFSQWHPDIRNFTANIDLNCAFNIIKNTEETILDTVEYRNILNLTNTDQCRDILNRIISEQERNSFLNILKERDSLYPRDIDRRYSVEEILKLVEENTYHPLLFLELNKRLYIIDGRTRFYCCLFNKVPARVKIIFDKELNESCK